MGRLRGPIGGKAHPVWIMGQDADGIVDVEVLDVVRAASPTLYNVTLTVADTEYSQILPDNTRILAFQCRTAFDVRFAFVPGHTATPTAPYMTLKANMTYWMDTADLPSGTLYLASSEAGVVVEIEAWA